MLSMTECPQCGYNLVNVTRTDCPPSHAINELTPSTQQADVSSVKDEVRRLDGLIHHLNQNRATLLRKINDIEATTRHLPPEVLSTIFQYARPPIDFSSHTIPAELPPDPDMRRDTYNREEDFHFDLAAVSHHWRQVVWSTPQLWTTVSLGLREAVVESHLSMLNLYFENAGNLPLSIELDFREKDLMWGEARAEMRAKFMFVLEPIRRNVFIHNAAKIQNLILITFPAEWVPSIGKGLSQCKSVTLDQLSLTPDEDSPWRIANGDAVINLAELPCLRHVRSYSPKNPFKMPPSTITTIHLRRARIDDCMELLVKCPNLIEFESRDPDIETPGAPSFTGPIIHENLESLAWYTRNDEWSSAFIRHFRFAKLRVLQWSGGHIQSGSCGRVENAELISFFSNLPTTLLSLTFNYCPRYSYDLLKELLRSVPHLHELHFLGSANVAHLAIRIIGRPFDRQHKHPDSPMATHSKGSQEPRFLPFLTKLSIVGTGFYDPNSEEIVDMLEGLHATGTECFHLVMIDFHKDFWKIQFRCRLRALVASGFNLKITFRSREMDLT